MRGGKREKEEERRMRERTSEGDGLKQLVYYGLHEYCNSSDLTVKSTLYDTHTPGMHKPDVSTEHAEVTYSIPGNSTGLKVRAFKVDTHTPERWVKYEVLYHYRVQMFPDLSID